MENYRESCERENFVSRTYNSIRDYSNGLTKKVGRATIATIFAGSLALGSYSALAQPANSGPDTDKDGLSDIYETGVLGTDPTMVDTDGDGFLDNIVNSGTTPELAFNFSEADVPGATPVANMNDYPLAWGRAGRKFYFVRYDSNNANPVIYKADRGVESSAIAITGLGEANPQLYATGSANFANNGVYFIHKTDTNLGGQIYQAFDDSSPISLALDLSPRRAIAGIETYKYGGTTGSILFTTVLESPTNLFQGALESYKFTLSGLDINSESRIVDERVGNTNVPNGIPVYPTVSRDGNEIAWTKLRVSLSAGSLSDIRSSDDSGLITKILTDTTFYTKNTISGARPLHAAPGGMAVGYMGRNVLYVQDVENGWDWTNIPASIPNADLDFRVDSTLVGSISLGGTNFLKRIGNQFLPRMGFDGIVLYSDFKNNGFANVKLASLRSRVGFPAFPTLTNIDRVEFDDATGSRNIFDAGTTIITPAGEKTLTISPAVRIVQSNEFKGPEAVLSRVVHGPAGTSFADSGLRGLNAGKHIRVDVLNKELMERFRVDINEVQAKDYDPVTKTFGTPLTITARDPNGKDITYERNGYSESALIAPEGFAWVDFNAINFFQLGTEALPMKTLAGGINLVSNGGRVKLKPGSSSETMTISKPVTLYADVGGSVLIGVGGARSAHSFISPDSENILEGKATSANEPQSGFVSRKRE